MSLIDAEGRPWQAAPDRNVRDDRITGVDRVRRVSWWSPPERRDSRDTRTLAWTRFADERRRARRALRPEPHCPTCVCRREGIA
jgi:hypothetical protein